MPIEVTSVGNAGFLINSGGRLIFLDAFFDHLPHVGTAPLFNGSDVVAADLILVTHSHPDHFSVGDVVEAQRKTSALVAGPLQVTREFAGKIPPGRLQVLEPPPRTAHPGQFPSMTHDFGFAKVTAYRTTHGTGHNSYLIESGGFRIFHDCDNEDTSRLPVAALNGIDLLVVAPWQGSGWARLVDFVQPRNWILTHLTKEEIELHAKDGFLPEISDHIPSPSALRKLRPGEKLIIGG